MATTTTNSQEGMTATTHTVSALLRVLLDHEQATRTPIPTHPFDLGVYIKESVGKHMNEEQQKMLFNEVAAYQQGKKEEAEGRRHSGGSHSHHSASHHHSQHNHSHHSSKGGGDHAPPAPAIKVITAAADGCGGAEEDDAINNNGLRSAAGGSASSSSVHITKAALAAHDRLIPPARPLAGNAAEASVPVISVLDATARHHNNDDDDDVTARPPLAPAAAAVATTAEPAVAAAALVVSGDDNANGIPTGAVLTRQLSRHACYAPAAITANAAGASSSAAKRPSASTTSALAIVNQQNAALNPHAALANVAAVTASMSTISRAMAITAALPEEEAARALAGCDYGTVAVSAADLDAIASVGAYILLAEEERCPSTDVYAVPFRKTAVASAQRLTFLEDGNTPSAASSVRGGEDLAVGGVVSLAIPPVGDAVAVATVTNPPENNAGANDTNTNTNTNNSSPAVPYHPRMDTTKRYHVLASPLHALTREDPFYLYETAEAMIERSDACSATWFEASEWLERAAQSFATLGLFRMAGNCQVRSYDCLKATGRLDDAGQALIAASHYYTQEALSDDSSSHRESNEAALAAMQNAIALYDEIGRDVTAAKLCAEAAELCVKARNPGLGLDILHVSAATFETAGQNSHAERCYARAAEIAILDMSDFAEAIDTLEKMAKVTPYSRQHLSYFKAFICRFVCVPPEQGIQFVIAMEDCQKTLELYEELCPQLLGAPNEYNLIKLIMATQKHMEDEALEAGISRYLTGTKLGLERWAELILRKIHDNMLQRKASVEKLYKL